MLLAEIVLDLNQASGWGNFLLLGALAVACFLLFVVPMLQETLTQAAQGKLGVAKGGTAKQPTVEPVAPVPPSNPPKPLKRRNVDRSSDTPPPTGFANHLQIIEATAPNADAAVWWQYAKNEMTEAEVAIAEATLARRLPPEK